MIVIKTEYPWGEGELKYEKWVLRRFVEKENPKTHMTIKTMDESMSATNQEQFQQLVELFNKDMETDRTKKNFNDCTSHYYEYSQFENEKYVEYIIGFLV